MVYDKDAVFPAAEAAKTAAKERAKRYGPKWEPKLRYVRDRFNIPSQHSGPNRKERRANDARYRNCYRDASTGIVYPGSRSRNRKSLRAKGRPVR